MYSAATTTGSTLMETWAWGRTGLDGRGIQLYFMQTPQEFKEDADALLGRGEPNEYGIESRERPVFDAHRGPRLEIVRGSAPSGTEPLDSCANCSNPLRRD